MASTSLTNIGWTRNPDTGKWTSRNDTLSKDSYDSIKEDLDKVKLYSKCLSGSTYLPIDNLENIYDVLDQDKIGFYINSPTPGVPNPILLNQLNSDEFYNKYLVENAFTLKNLFTPTKLINDQLNNYLYVDVATTESLILSQSIVNLTIDGIRLKEGQRVLVKDQIKKVTLPSSTDPDIYFSTTQLVAKYYEIENSATDITYNYYDSDNGIYIYKNNKLVRESDLDEYESAYRYSVVAKLGVKNREKQWHLSRLLNGYYPIIGQNIQFLEKHNWVLRNRVDYNNIYEINYYDVLTHGAQTIYSEVDSRTYSIPNRTIAVGEFGMIINNQDVLRNTATYSQSHIMNNKYKVNLNSVAMVGDYYWICGDEGTLLRVSKIDFSIKRIELNETNNFTSISFFNNLNGMVVGKFNTIYWTNDGGDHWNKIAYPEFDLYSYNKVIQYDFNQAYVAGESGIFIEFNYSGGTWLAYKRKIAKQLSNIDEYSLVDDINDMFKTSWTKLANSTYSVDQTSLNFSDQLVYTNTNLNNLNQLEISVDTKSISGYKNQYLYTNTSLILPQSEENIIVNLETNLNSGDIIEIIINSSIIGNFTIDNLTNISYPPGKDTNLYWVRDGNTYLSPNAIKLSDYNTYPISIRATVVSNTTQLVFRQLSRIEGREDVFSERDLDLNLLVVGIKKTIPSFYTALQIKKSNDILYINPNFTNTLPSIREYSTYDLYQSGTNSNNKFNYSLPLDSFGNLIDDTYTVEANVIYNYDVASNSVIGYSQASISYKLNVSNGRLILICGNNDNIICYDIDSIITKNTNQFIYYGFTQSHSDVKTITRMSGTTSVYIGGDKVYKFQINDFSNISNPVTNFASSYSYNVANLYVNKLVSGNSSLYLAGNNSLLKYGLTSFNDLDPTVNDGIKSKFLFLDYDIASKLDFFDNDRQYRLPSSVTFATDLPYSFSIGNLSNEYNWLSYYKDAEKTFKYYTSMSDSNVVKFSSTFSYHRGYNSFVFNKDNLSININDIEGLAPSLLSGTASKFIEHSTPIVTSIKGLENDYVLLNKHLIIFKRNELDPTEVGDVLHLSSDIIECNLLVNKVSYYVEQYGPSGRTHGLTSSKIPTRGNTLYKYIYCYVDFNQSITNNLKTSNSIVTVTNLNKWSDITTLVDNINNYHPVGIGYKLTYSDDKLKVEGRFNNNTAYYNMQSLITCDSATMSMSYKESFLNFGYSPTYNLFSYLNNVNSTVFTSEKYFTALPHYTSLVGNGGNSATNSNIYVSSLAENKITFGSDLKFQWDSLLINTFVDIVCHSGASSKTTTRALITKKYYDSNIPGYSIEFNKKVERDSPVDYFDILSRNTLSQISDDLQLLNNIQRTSTSKSVQTLQSFTNLENEIKSKFSTDSYFKVLACDYDIRRYISAIIYTDNNYQIAMNILNLDKEIKYDVYSTEAETGTGYSNKLKINLTRDHDLKVGDLINAKFTGGDGTSQELNPTYFGYQTVIDVLNSNSIVTSVDYVNTTSSDPGSVSMTKKDPFFNYQPIDLFNLGIDHNVTRSVEIKPENFDLVGKQYKLINLDLTKYKFQFVDGLYLEEVTQKFPWLLEAEISNAIIGRDDKGLIWYSGTWKCGRWFGGTWISGKWVSGDWYSGTWNSYNTNYKVISVQVDTSFVDNSVSKWFGGRWFDGTWNGGTWYNGRRYAGDWKGGNWYNGIWNDGHWFSGNFEGGIWVEGTWDGGIFNCNAKPSYWIGGQFTSGDFENGIWYSGQFGNDKNILSRFGTKSTNSRTSTWHGGKWLSGEFHSYLNTNDSTGKTDVSEIHKYSIWRTGIWMKGDFYGGVAFNIDFRSGTWRGGILEEIQIVNVGTIYPGTINNTIVINGIFKFNIGDEIWIIDDDTNTRLSPLGSNINPMVYRINKVLEDTTNKLTTLYLNYDFSTLGISGQLPLLTPTETGLRVVSHFRDSNWQSGIWTNGIFDGGQFDSGIWYNGIFNGSWGN